MRRILGRFGVWLCNRYFPRPSTEVERQLSLESVKLMSKYMEWYGNKEAGKFFYHALYKEMEDKLKGRSGQRSKWMVQ